MKTARRNFLILGSGAAAGAVFTPAPWKLLDDVSIWTQNWSWIPRPLQGEIKTRHTVCTLCPAACGVRARCVGDQPIAVAGVPGHPVSAGKLCAMGLGAHQLPWHPMRIRTAAPVDQVRARLDEKRRAVMLDLYPARAASAVYARREGLTYATLDRPETSTARRLASFSGEAAGLDISKARTILSFGAPVLERWGRVLAAWSGAERPKVIQIEPALSRSAALADAWVPVKPGTEGMLARAIAGAADLDAAAALCGVPRERIEALKAELNDGALALSGGEYSIADEEAIAALNTTSAAVVRRAASPIAQPKGVPYDSLPDRSIELLLIDHGPVAASPAWDVVAPKLAKGAVIVSFSPYLTEAVKRADLIVPTAAWLEGADDAVETTDAAAPFYTVAPALLPKPPGVVDPTDVISGEEGAREAEMKARVAALHAAAKGEIFSFADGSTAEVKSFESPDKLWERFVEGACWTGEAAVPLRFSKAPVLRAPGDPAPPPAPPALLPGAGVLPPLACKLTRESKLFTRSV